VRELEGERTATAGHRAQVGRVLESFGHGHMRADDLILAIGLHALDPTAALIEIADDVAHAVVRAGHLDLHNGLE